MTTYVCSSKCHNNTCKVCGLVFVYSKLINISQPGTIHEQAINKPSKDGAKLSVFQCHENLTLVVRSAQAIGCSVVNIGPVDLYEGREHLILGLIWQVIRVSICAFASFCYVMMCKVLIT